MARRQCSPPCARGTRLRLLADADPPARVDPSVEDDEVLSEAATCGGGADCLQALLADSRVDPSSRDNVALRENLNLGRRCMRAAESVQALPVLGDSNVRWGLRGGTRSASESGSSGSSGSGSAGAATGAAAAAADAPSLAGSESVSRSESHLQLQLLREVIQCLVRQERALPTELLASALRDLQSLAGTPRVVQATAERQLRRVTHVSQLAAAAWARRRAVVLAREAALRELDG